MRILSLQALRAIAAGAVVYVHATDKAVGELVPARLINVGHGGVDVFFVLSGFLMTYLHGRQFGENGASRQFLMRRLIRIAPIYWLLTLLVLVVLAVAPSLFMMHRELDWPWALGSLLFAPIPDSSGNFTRPLVVGWTLDFEMHFYLLFALALLWRKGLVMLTALLLVLVCAGAIFNPSQAWFQLLTSPLLLEFLAGIGVAVLVRRFKIPPVMGVTMIVIAVVLFVWQPYPWRVVKRGVPAALLVTGTLYAQFACKSALGRLMVLLGDASYSIYLTQVLTIPVAAIALQGFGLAPDLYALVLWLISLCAGVAFWRIIERPITEWLKGRLLPSRLAVRGKPP